MDVNEVISKDNIAYVFFIIQICLSMESAYQSF